MLDRDLAELYDVETKRLKEAVRRNIERFPHDFMFDMTIEELENWRTQIASSNFSDKMGLRHKPFCFTEQGVAMLSSVLNSKLERFRISNFRFRIEGNRFEIRYNKN